MATRKDMLYKAGNESKKNNGVIPATVSFRHNKKKGLIDPLSAQEKMLCALRKVLTSMSDRGEGRYYIANNKGETANIILQRVVSSVKHFVGNHTQHDDMTMVVLKVS